WTERATNATIYKLILTNIAKNTNTVVYIDASSNASSYEERYDRFTFTLGALEKGQYRYEVLQDANGYSAGDALGGGLFVFEDSGYAYISAAVDQSTTAQWGCEGTLMVEGASPEAIGQGVVNTATIIAGCPTSGISARICDQLVLNGYSDWFLPSLDELTEMYTKLKVNGFGNFANQRYWSSTQDFDDPANKALTIDFNNGTLHAHNKSQTNRHTRAMRRFLMGTPRVIETGLAYIEPSTQTFVAPTNNNTYVSF
ncbi:MAG: DUF1566 domain-containing protein, partial [Caulobacteraceae bacterium]|nr:DUF1566 domain-containing protein [Caulobacteraceae bacterium]